MPKIMKGIMTDEEKLRFFAASRANKDDIEESFQQIFQKRLVDELVNKKTDFEIASEILMDMFHQNSITRRWIKRNKITKDTILIDIKLFIKSTLEDKEKTGESLSDLNLLINKEVK